MTADGLRAFAEEVAALFNAGRIPHPVHLDGGNEDQLLDVFQTIHPHDYVAGQWRMQSKCLLHGVPRAKLLDAVMHGRSIALCFPEHRIVSSAIVGGIMPIALGIAWEIRKRGGSERVHCFIGDMTAMSGIAHECFQYSRNFDLPVRWIVENNGKSVCTDTLATWGAKEFKAAEGVWTYSYDLPWPHAGAGVRVSF